MTASMFFIAANRRAAKTRSDALMASLIAGVVGAVALAGAAHWQRAIAAQNRAIAAQNKARAASLFLANLARQQRAEGDAGTALLLALEALPDTIAGTARPYVPEAEVAVDEAWRSLRERIVFKGHRLGLLSAAFSPDGKRIVTASWDKTVRLWDGFATPRNSLPMPRPWHRAA